MSMIPRDVVRTAIEGKPPPYVPWSFSFTHESMQVLRSRPADDLDVVIDGCIAWLGDPTGGPFTPLGDGRVRDPFGVVWNRSVDKDIGIVEGLLLPEPDIRLLKLPDPLSPTIFGPLEDQLATRNGRFAAFPVGFSLYERAWTLRGTESLMMDFIENPKFVDDLLDAIADYNITQVKKVLEYDVDAVEFGDDWGQQHGIQMGPDLWRRFIKPRLARMYKVVRDAGRYVMIHSCGDVDELFDELIEIGVNCFNPFQPEVMDVEALMRQYHGRLAFHGGLSTQRTLPFGTVEDVRCESRRLLELGRRGGYIFSPAHAVEGDVPLENMLAFMRVAADQPGLRR